MEFEQLIQLIQTVSDSTLTGFKYEQSGIKISMQKEKVQKKSLFSVPFWYSLAIPLPPLLHMRSFVNLMDQRTVKKERKSNP